MKEGLRGTTMSAVTLELSVVLNNREANRIFQRVFFCVSFLYIHTDMQLHSCPCPPLKRPVSSGNFLSIICWLGIYAARSEAYIHVESNAEHIS